MKEINRREFVKLTAVTAAGVVLGGCQEAATAEAGQIRKGDCVRWFDRGAYGPGKDSSMELIGPDRGEGEVLKLKQDQGYCWARVKYWDQKRGRYGIAWHIVDTLEEVSCKSKEED